MLKKIVSISIILLFLLATILAASALEVKKEVVFTTYDANNEYQFYEDTTINEIQIDPQNITLNNNIRYAIYTGGDFVNFKIKNIVFPYQIVDTSYQEKFLSSSEVTFINPTYIDYYIQTPQGDSYLSVVTKDKTGLLDAKALRVQVVLIFMTVLLGTLILLLERRKRRKSKQNNI